jgi:hypothetical protein
MASLFFGFLFRQFHPDPLEGPEDHPSPVRQCVRVYDLARVLEEHNLIENLDDLQLVRLIIIIIPWTPLTSFLYIILDLAQSKVILSVLPGILIFFPAISTSVRPLGSPVKVPIGLL